MAKISLLKSRNDAGLPTPKRGNAIVVLNKDILKWPAVAPDQVTYVGNFVFKEGAGFGELYMTPATQAATFEAGGNPDGMGSKNKFVGEHPGTEREAMSFLKEFANEGFVIFYGGCGTSTWKVMGSQCHSMILSAGGKDDKDGNITTMTFEQEMLNNDRVMFYDGNVETLAPVSVVGSAVALASPKGGVYRLPVSDAAADITFTATTIEDKAFVTLVGAGGTTPATLKNTTTGSVLVLLKEGTQWSALQGATITLQVVKSDKTYLIEVDRT